MKASCDYRFLRCVVCDQIDRMRSPDAIEPIAGYCESAAGMVMRRLLQVDAVGHSSKAAGSVW